MLALNYDKISIEETYKNGVFKPSTFSFQYPQIIFEHLFSIYSLNFTSKTVLTYIDSLLSLIRFSLVIFRMRQELLNVISKDKESFLKGVLAYAELFFLTRNVWHFENDQIVTPEEIGEACSYIASLYFDKTEILPARNCDIDTNKLKEYMGAILSAHIIKQYLYAEMMIGKLPYFAKIEDKTLSICPIDMEYEKYRKAGYVNHEIQRQKVYSNMIKNLGTKNNLAIFLDSKKDELEKKFVLKIEERGIERYVLGIDIDNEEVKELFKSFFNQNNIFSDEVNLVAYICSQFHIEPKNLYSFKINDKITVLEVIKVRRLFMFMSVIFGHALKKECRENAFPPPAIVIRSILAAFEKSKLNFILESFFEKETTKAFLETFTYTPKADSLFDIQYKPIIDMGSFYYCNVQTLSASDLIRNSLVYHKQRFFEDNSIEPLVDKLYNSLSNRLANSKRNYDVGSQEVDCVAISDNFIFLFEVKNNFLPCNHAEERTTYDYLIKSSKQLRNAVNELNKKNVQNKIENDFKISDASLKKIYTCTILGNRVFTGYTIDGHVIRYIDEATNFLDTGKALRDGEEYNMWKGDSFAETDLVWFIESGGTNSALVTHCKESPDIFMIGDCCLKFETVMIPPEEIYHPDFLEALERANE